MNPGTATILSSSHFQRLLPEWLKAMHRRAQRLERDGWDINMLQLLHDDAASLTHDCTHFGQDDFARQLDTLRQQLQGYVQEQTTPLAAQSAQLVQQLKALARHAAPAKPVAVNPAARVEPARRESPALLDDTVRAELAHAFPTSRQATADAATHRDLLAGNAFDDSEFTSQRGRIVRNRDYRIHHFSDGNAFARVFDPLLEADGNHVSIYQTLASVLEALAREAPPHLLILDASLLDHAAALREAIHLRHGQNQTIRLLTFCAAENPKLQQAALRAGIDVVIALPARIEYVLQRVHETLGVGNASLRVLIVQDDDEALQRTDDILSEAGMQTLPMPSAFLALAQAEDFRPDLILIDLHLPECDGLELAGMLRARQAFAAASILLLHPVADTERRLQALAIGCDELLVKPVAPPELIAEIRARVQRARQLRSSPLQDATQGARNRL